MSGTGTGDFGERVIKVVTLDDSDLNFRIPCKACPWAMLTLVPAHTLMMAPLTHMEWWRCLLSVSHGKGLVTLAFSHHVFLAGVLRDKSHRPLCSV